MMLWREVVGILQPMGVVELGSTVTVQQGSSSVTVVKGGTVRDANDEGPAKLTLRIRSAASGDTESGIRRSTLQILRYVATT